MLFSTFKDVYESGSRHMQDETKQWRKEAIFDIDDVTKLCTSQSWCNGLASETLTPLT